MAARVDIPLPLACGPAALECWNPPPGCAAAREPPPLECAAALLPPPDFCLSAEAICGAINISETQIQMNALMSCLPIDQKRDALASPKCMVRLRFFSRKLELVLTGAASVGSNGLMSRRAVILIVVFLGALLAGNIVILGIWLPIWKGRAAHLQSSNQTTVSSPATPSQLTNHTPLAPAGTAAPSSDLVLERQLTSPSDNL